MSNSTSVNISDGAAALSAFMALIAVFGSVIKIKLCEYWNKARKKIIQVHFYNKARLHKFSGPYIDITPELTIINNSYSESVVIYGCKIFHPLEIEFDNGIFIDSLRTINIKIPDSNWIHKFREELIEKKYISAIRSFLPAFDLKSSHSFKTDITQNNEDRIALYNVVRSQYNPRKVISHSTWLITDENGYLIEFPFILKPRKMCLLKLQNAHFTVCKDNLNILSDIHFTLHTQDKDLKFKAKYNENTFTKQLKKQIN